MRIAAIIALVATAAGSSGVPMAPIAIRQFGSVRPIDTLANIPLAWRNRNWTGPRGQGSCVHAAMRHLFHWQGQHELAEWWARNHADGETFAGLSAKLDAAGVRWAGTDQADENFLTWAIHTRRGAAVVIQNGAHMVNLVGMDDRRAMILDSNNPESIDVWDRQEFLQVWRASGGWAVTPAYQSAPPRPRVFPTPQN